MAAFFRRSVACAQSDEFQRPHCRPPPLIHRALAIERAFKGVISAQLVLLPAAWQVVIMGVALRSEAG